MEWNGECERVCVCLQLDRIYASRENIDNIVEREEREKSFWIGRYVEFSEEGEVEKNIEDRDHG